MTGTDIEVIWEAVFMISLPFCVMAAGAFLRRRFAKPAADPDGAAPVETGVHKAARLTGQLLFWGGIFAVLFAVVVILNFKGVI